jgi:hypothetical protein
MTEPPPYIDVANLSAPAEGIVVTMFITVRSVARSRDFYSRVLGGTVVLEENSHGAKARKSNRPPDLEELGGTGSSAPAPGPAARDSRSSARRYAATWSPG